MVPYSAYFWPIVDGRLWTFRANTTDAVDLLTYIQPYDIQSNGHFSLLIDKSHKETYWGPEERKESAYFSCMMDEHGIYMLSLVVYDPYSDKSKQFYHFTNSAFASSPWLHRVGWPVYPFIPEAGIVWDQLDKWNNLNQLIVKVPETVFHNAWSTRCSIDKLFVPYLNATIDTLRVDYLETNTPCIRGLYCTPVDFSFGWSISPQPDGPLLINETGSFQIRPIRVNETWWFAWGLGPVKIRHCHNTWDKITQQWSNPSDTDWKYGPVHSIDLINIE